VKGSSAKTKTPNATRTPCRPCLFILFFLLEGKVAMKVASSIGRAPSSSSIIMVNGESFFIFVFVFLFEHLNFVFCRIEICVQLFLSFLTAQTAKRSHRITPKSHASPPARISWKNPMFDVTMVCFEPVRLFACSLLLVFQRTCLYYGFSYLVLGRPQHHHCVCASILTKR
jgi:hypothetical protein